MPFSRLMPLLQEQYLRDVPISAGTGIAYHPGLLHASKPNRSSRLRAAAVAVFVPEDAPLLHYFQPSPEAIDVYQVPADFYWKSVVLGAPPPEELRIGRESGAVDWIDEPRLREFCSQAAVAAQV